jgi:hypothetical protein
MNDPFDDEPTVERDAPTPKERPETERRSANGQRLIASAKLKIMIRRIRKTGRPQ